jgi:subtilisin family serine protease
MRAHPALLLIAALAALTMAGSAFAQNRYYSRAPIVRAPPPRGEGGYHGGYRGGFRRPGWGGPVIIMTAPPDGYVVDDDTPRHARHIRRSARRRGPSGAPPAGEHRFVPDEVVIEVANSASARQIDALQRRFRLTRLERRVFLLTGTTLYRWRIPDRRSVASVVRALERDALVVSAQPNYLFAVQQTVGTASEGDAAQYELAKLHLPQAHQLAKGDNVRVALIDSAVDLQNPELAGSIAGTFDTLATPRQPDKHGTAIAGLIAAHGKLMGAAPAAKLLAVRAFAPEGSGAQGTTFNILKGLDWAAANGARIINMSFAGPHDPALHRTLAAAHRRGIVLIAAAGNGGAKSPPLYPGADPNVIAVSATDADDRLFAPSNRGRYIAVAAPGEQILVAIPDGYEVSSGTSYSAAEVSGIAALLLQRDPTLTPDKLRHVLEATAKDLGPKGRDDEFGAGLVDAYAAVSAQRGPVAGAAQPIEPVSARAR